MYIKYSECFHISLNIIQAATIYEHLQISQFWHMKITILSFLSEERFVLYEINSAVYCIIKTTNIFEDVLCAKLISKLLTSIHIFNFYDNLMK